MLAVNQKDAEQDEVGKRLSRHERDSAGYRGLSRFHLRWRIYLAFLFSIALFTFGGALTVFILEDERAILEQTQNYQARRLSDLTILFRRLTDANSALSVLLSGNDEETADDQLFKSALPYVKELKSIRFLLEEIRSDPALVEAEERYLLNVIARLESYQQVISTAVEVPEGTQHVKLADMRHTSDGFLRISEAFGEYVDYYSERTDGDMGALLERYSFYIPLFVTSMIIGLFVLGGVAWGVSSSIVNDLARVTQTLGLLAQGRNVSQLEGLERKDEFGDIARAADLFRHNLKRLDDLRHLQKNESALKDRIKELGDAEGRLESQVEFLQGFAQNLDDARHKAEAAVMSKNQFLANISYELRAPLNNVIGFSQIMAQEMFGPIQDPRYKDYAILIEKSGTDLLQLVDDILDLADLEAGKIKLEEEAQDIRELFDSCERMASSRAREAGVTLSFEILPEGLQLVCDFRVMQQALLNLLSNAIKFSERGGQVHLWGGLNNVGNVCLSVKDTGRGMDPVVAQQALEPYGQSSVALVRGQRGIGLGLPLTSGFVAMHGGRVTIDSEIGKGTMVTCLFPAERTQLPKDNLRVEQAE
ncbi:sensor histidine kinase [Kiloniella laminariae]|uniref:sensor histidine kinase n=1 Tax=Kiloniella laminariae TaxID=454162 RepID=UPI00035E5899|nr:HAMP domain-containing sensor histidine kinase [Kiloniella laminariae]